jgi:hypothetical protein
MASPPDLQVDIVDQRKVQLNGQKSFIVRSVYTFIENSLPNIYQVVLHPSDSWGPFLVCILCRRADKETNKRAIAGMNSTMFVCHTYTTTANY